MDTGDRSCTEQIDLFPYGDRELWYAESEDKSWSLPLYVHWRLDKEHNEHYGLVLPACGLYTSQHLQVEALFQAHSILSESNRWIVPRRIIETILHKAPGVTVRYYYRWPDSGTAFIPMVEPERVNVGAGPSMATVSDSFIKHVCKEYNLPNSVVRIVLRAITAEAPKWMLDLRKPLDLGFCKLIALPFRPNWKEIIAAKFKHWRLIDYFGMRGTKKRQAFEEADMEAAMCSPQNIGLKRNSDRDHHVSYCIEAVPTKRFEEAVAKVENKRQSCGRVSYVASFEKTVEALYHPALDALEHYLRKVRRPFAKVSESGMGSLLRFVPTLSHRVRVGHLQLKDLPCCIVPTDRRFSVLAEAKGKHNLVRPTPLALPEVSAVSQETDDVRGSEEQRDLGQPREEGTDGMPLLHAGES